MRSHTFGILSIWQLVEERRCLEAFWCKFVFPNSLYYVSMLRLPHHVGKKKNNKFNGAMPDGGNCQFLDSFLGVLE